MNNILMFRSDQHLHAQTFQQSLKGETALERVYGGGVASALPGAAQRCIHDFLCSSPGRDSGSTPVSADLDLCGGGN